MPSDGVIDKYRHFRPELIFGAMWDVGAGVIVTHIPVSDRNVFSKKRYVAISPSAGAHVGERNLLLSAKCHPAELSDKYRVSVRSFGYFKLQVGLAGWYAFFKENVAQPRFYACDRKMLHTGVIWRKHDSTIPVKSTC